jgi:hypothetical protein
MANNQSLPTPVIQVKPGVFDPLRLHREILDPSCKMSAPMRLVALTLVRHADEHGLCWPSYARVAECTGLSRRTVIECMAKLRVASEAPIDVQSSRRTNDKGAPTSNMYRLRSRDADPVVQAPHQEGGGAAGAPTTTRGTIPRPRISLRKVVQQAHRGGAAGAPELPKEQTKPRNATGPSAPSSSAPSMTSPNTDGQLRAKRIGHDDRLFLPQALTKEDRQAAKDAIAGFLRSLRAA